jgi:hypothetical protein
VKKKYIFFVVKQIDMDFLPGLANKEWRAHAVRVNQVYSGVQSDYRSLVLASPSSSGTARQWNTGMLRNLSTNSAFICWVQELALRLVAAEPLGLPMSANHLALLIVSGERGVLITSSQSTTELTGF